MALSEFEEQSIEFKALTKALPKEHINKWRVLSTEPVIKGGKVYSVYKHKGMCYSWRWFEILPPDRFLWLTGATLDELEVNAPQALTGVESPEAKTMEVFLHHGIELQVFQ